METSLGADACYRALLARDPRFDGLFFTGVSTTGVYCRPVCPARTPRRDRCSFHRTAAEAERAGFRACFRCRPELAPTARREAPPLVARAVARVEAAATSGESLEDVAASLGVSSRHLRRAVERHTGVTPIELVQTQRLALAKRLLQDTSLPVTEVAFASGWQSLRRFHAAFGARFGCPPSAVRRGAGARPEGLRLRLDYRPPLAWDELLAFLRARAVDGVEAVDASYRRVIRTRGGLGVLTVRPDPERAALWAELPAEAAPDVVAWIARLRRLFDLDARPDVVDAVLARDPLLRRGVRARPGVRVPGALDPFEAAVRVVLGQLVRVEVARRLAGRLVERFGEALPAPAAGLSRAFPSAARVAALDVATLASLGVPARRAAALSAVAAAFAAEPTEEAALARLEGAPGIGPWTREVLAMRLGVPDAFPATDLGVRRALGAPAEARARAEAWRPFRAYAVMRIWHLDDGPAPAARRASETLAHGGGR